MPSSTKPSMCFLVDPEPGTRHVVHSVLRGMNIESEPFELIAGDAEALCGYPS